MANIGCGANHHPDWINLDLFANSRVKRHNIKRPLPFNDNELDVIYHSHVLEHLKKYEAEKFIKECFRSLKTGGIIRIAVPDLEIICREYLKNLDKATNTNNETDILNYQWNKIEMMDQLIRTDLGGEFAKIVSDEPKNKEYIASRCGDVFFKKEGTREKRIKKILYLLTNLRIKELLTYFQIFISKDKARISGEKHYWSYDRLDLKILLEKTGFTNIKIKKFNESEISNWESYSLDDDGKGAPRKPDSLFMEGVK